MLNDEDFRDVAERTSLIREMTEHPGWAMLLDRASVSLGSRQKALYQGQIENMEDYLKQTSWLEGASFIIGLPAVVQNELNREAAERKEYEEMLKEDNPDWVLESAAEEE